MSPPPRVLLLEDDPSIRRFVAMALSGLPIDLLQAASIAQAKAALAQGDVSLLIADLMLPDGSGMDLLADVQADRGSHAALRTVVFSAGVSATLREQATQLGAWGVIEKPVSFKDLVQCVQQALAHDEGVGPSPAIDAPQRHLHIDPDQRQRAIDAHFGGRAALFDAFMSHCVDQLPMDLQAGDAASTAGDVAALRRVAHNLKSVLQLIGSVGGHAAARELESACMAGAPLDALTAQWQALRLQVSEICRPAGAAGGVTAA